MNVKFVKGDWGGVREHGFRLVLAWPDVARGVGATKMANSRWQIANYRRECTKVTI